MTCAGTLGNWFHLLLVAPFLYWMSYNPNPTYLFAAGTIVLGVHLSLILWKCGLISSELLGPCCGTGTVETPTQPGKEPMLSPLNQASGYAWEDFQLQLR